MLYSGEVRQVTREMGPFSLTAALYDCGFWRTCYNDRAIFAAETAAQKKTVES